MIYLGQNISLNFADVNFVIFFFVTLSVKIHFIVNEQKWSRSFIIPSFAGALTDKQATYLIVTSAGTFLTFYTKPTHNLFKLQYTICSLLTLKAPITNAADDIHKYFFIVFKRNKT